MKAAWVNLPMKDVIGAIFLICSSLLWMDGWMDYIDAGLICSVVFDFLPQ